jgi:hypothetical protein
MMESSVGWLIHLSEELSHSEGELRKTGHMQLNDRINDIKAMLVQIEEVRTAVAEHRSLKMSLARCDDVIDEISRWTGTCESLAERIYKLRRELRIEIERDHVFLFLAPDEADYYRADLDKHFTPALPACIKSHCEADLTEALMCAGTDRNTACVFHLCRVLEAILVKVVWPSVGSPALSNAARPTWGIYLTAVEDAIKAGRRGGWSREQTAFYESIVSDYSKVKDAERASVAHIGKMFNARRVRSLLLHVGALLEDAAPHFDDEGNYKP